MSNLPRSRLSLTDTGGGIATGSDLLIVAAPVNQGPLYTRRFYTSVAALLTDFGPGKHADFVAHYIDIAKKPIVFVGMTPVPGSIGPVITTGILGNATPTLAGTPNDDAHIYVIFPSAAVLGTQGAFQYSLDNGQTLSPLTRLGTALTYLIPNTAITITFGSNAATYNAGDTFNAHAYGPTYDSTGLTALTAELAANGDLSRLVMLLGDSSATLAQATSDAMNSYESSTDRETRAVAALRPRYADATAVLTADTVTFASTTATRSAGSWLTDGFKVGMTASFTGTASNNVAEKITALSATVLTVAAGFASESAGSGVAHATATEAETDWMAALDAITLGQVWSRVVLGAGDAIRTSPIDKSRKKRNATWAMVCRYMAHDVQVSPADATLGRLEDWTLYGADGRLACHDERASGGLLNSRITCLRTLDGDIGGAYVALALTLELNDRPLSRLPIACVGDITCTICRSETTKLLNSKVILDPKTGYMTTAEQRRIEGKVQSKLENELLAAKTEGQRASAVTFSIVNNTDLRQPGATVSWECDLTGLGYLEQLSGVVRVQGAQ